MNLLELKEAVAVAVGICIEEGIDKTIQPVYEVEDEAYSDPFDIIAAKLDTTLEQFKLN